MAQKTKRVRLKPRNPYVVPARARKAGTMSDRRAERGGARNDERELLDEWKKE